MDERSTCPRTYADPDGYDSYMGGWSSLLAPLFLGFAAVGQPRSLLDVGCGTGNLLVAAAAELPHARLVGIDSSPALLQKARLRPELARVEFKLAMAETLPLETGEFDCCLSLLVLQEFSDPLGPISEMRRVTRAGGVVAACQWDFARMPVVAALVDAIASVDSHAGEDLSTGSARLFNDENGLATAWTRVGHQDVSTARIKVVRRFSDIESLWRPLLCGSTPSTSRLTALSPMQQFEVRERMRKWFTSASSDPGFSVTAEALAVRGSA